MIGSRPLVSRFYRFVFVLHGRNYGNGLTGLYHHVLAVNRKHGYLTAGCNLDDAGCADGTHRCSNGNFTLFKRGYHTVFHRCLGGVGARPRYVAFKVMLGCGKRKRFIKVHVCRRLVKSKRRLRRGFFYRDSTGSAYSLHGCGNRHGALGNSRNKTAVYGSDVFVRT